MHIVTAGYRFLDIDAYASAIALAELLRLQGQDAQAATTAPLNASIPASLRRHNAPILTDYTSTADDVFTIVDLSEPDFFDFGIRPDRVVGIVDHHLGFKDFWKEKLGDRAHIEFIGAACTQVYELWQQSGLINQMSKTTAKLLACGILDNTLNLKALITTDRDKTAYAELAQHAELPADWPEQYFEECQAYMAHDLKHTIKNDAKLVDYPTRTDTIYVGQLALWDADSFIHTHKDAIVKIMNSKKMPWYMNFIDIRTTRSIFMCEDIVLAKWLAGLLDITFKGETGIAERMWLRKEIMKQAIEREGEL